MSSGKRKLSFLGFAPQQATGEGELRLDEDAPPPHHDGSGAAPDSEGSPRRVQQDGAPPPDLAARALDHQRRAEGAHPHRARTYSLRESTEPPGGGEGEGSPHALFVQLDELVDSGEGEGEGGWRETARWIKYEEDVEESGERWGRPHVASLSFHSLLNLRRCLETGAVVLDARERDLPGAAWRVAHEMSAAGHIPEEAQQAVLGSLLLRHHRLHSHAFRFSIGTRSRSEHTSLQSLWQQPGEGRARASSGAAPLPPAAAAEPRVRRHSALPRISLAPLRSLAETRRRRSSHALEARKRSSGAEGGGSGDSREELQPRNEALMRRIPAGAEAAAVLVGAVPYLPRAAVAFLRLAEAVPMPTVTEVPLPVRFLFVLLGPPRAEVDHREVGRSISTLLSNETFQRVAYRATDPRELLSAIDDFLDESIVLPPGDWERRALLPLEDLRAQSDHIRRRKRDALERRRASAAPPPAPAPAPAAPAPLSEKQALLAAESAQPPAEPDDPLARTGRLFGGVVRDMRRRYPLYVSDLRDAVSGQCAAAAIFMYFAALSSAITFGGLLAEKTDNQIGISETLVFTCVGGVVFALVSGQPLMITGATGPLLLLDSSLAGFCRERGFDFLAARMYAGLWMLVIALGVAALEGSAAVRKITRFTEDIFAFLISLIFISEPITATLAVYRAHPLGADYCAGAGAGSLSADGTSPMPNSTSQAENGTFLPSNVSSLLAHATPPGPQPNTALWCTILTLATFAIAYFLRIFRNGKFLGRSARRALGDFGVPIAIVSMVALSLSVPVWTETLRVPAGLRPTAPRPWLVPLAGRLGTLPAWAVAAMALPALMVYIIVFMETHIAELIVDKPERRLRKGSGFHMDVVVMSAVNAACGLFGAPWQCVATVRSVSHVAALTVMSTTHAPGDKPHIVRVHEQRVTGLVVSLLVGGSVAGARWLRLVPMSVLFGVFLYMGISALAGIQFWERALLLLQPRKYHGAGGGGGRGWVRRVPTSRMHAYTLVQVACCLLLYCVKSSRISLALPFFLVLMVPLRMSLAKCFTPQQLRALDGAQKEIDDDDEPDFYQEAPLPG